MSFLNEVLEDFGLSDMLNANGYKITVLGDKGVYIENAKSIKSFTPEKIEIRLNKNSVVIEGETLFVKKYCIGDIVICGKVKNVAID